MTNELVNIIRELAAAKGIELKEIINWNFKDGSGDNYFINGNYELNKIGGYKTCTNQRKADLKERFTLKKITKTDYENILKGKYKLFDLVDINIIEIAKF